MDNLALNKPALQSSVSAWSSSPVPEQAARGGNDGDLSRDLGVHTDRERDPWWQVDLQGTYAVERVCLFNRDAFPERLLRFSVLGSLDGVTWDLLASKSDDRVFGPDGAPFTLDLPFCPSLRFLRIRLDGLNCLHFKECRVFGVPADPDAAAPEAAPGTDPTRVVFSALYNESDAFLPTYLANFLHYTGEECVLLVNLPPGRTVPEVPSHHRVVVFNGRTQRQKFGHTLLVGHLESYATALQRDRFDYFCPIASNSLFFRRFDPSAMIRQLRAGHKVPTDLDVTFDIGLDIDRLPGNWHWPKIAGNPPLRDFLKHRWGLAHLSQNQIEGLTASTADWNLLHERMAEFPLLGDLLAHEGSAFLPLEEILPASFFLQSGSGRYVNICHVFWNRFNHTGSGRVTIDELVGFGRSPAHLCLVKWFERDPCALETVAVTRPWGQTLLASLPSGPAVHGAGERLLQRLLLESLAAALRLRETTTPFTEGWQTHPTDALPCTFHDPCLLAVRQMLRLPTGRDGSDAYLYLDHTQHRIDLSVTIAQASASLVRLDCARIDAPAEDAKGPTLEGFLYLRASSAGVEPLVRVRVLTSQAGREQVMRSIVVMRDGSYMPVASLHSEPQGDAMDYYFSVNGLPGNDGFWFGIPFFADLRFQAELTLVQVGIPGSAGGEPAWTGIR